jgi:predicted membrane protein
MSEQKPLQTKTRGFEVTGYTGLAFSFFGIAVFGLILSYGGGLFSIALPFLLPGILFCTYEAKRYKRRTGKTSRPLVLTLRLSLILAVLATIIDAFSIYVLVNSKA